MLKSRASILSTAKHVSQFRWKSTKSLLPKCTSELFRNPPASGSPIKINGWVSATRVSKTVAFIDIVDGTTSEDVKCIIRPPNLLPENIITGSSVLINGIWSEGKGKQKFEVQVRGEDSGKVKLVGEVDKLFPMIKKDHSAQYLRTIPEYRFRQKHLAAILRFRSQVEATLIEFFNKQSFTKTNPPLVTSSDCEGAGELFQIESSSKLDKSERFFGKDAYLTVSTQLHLEVLCSALSRVWTLTPCFRAEESDTNRHLSEFWMLEAEIAFVDNVAQLTEFSENMIKSVVQGLIDNVNDMGTNLKSTKDKEALGIMSNRWHMLLAKQWNSITYTEAIEILEKAYINKDVEFKYEPIWGESLKSEHEKWLAGEHFKNTVFVTDYPITEKPFYMKINPEDSKVPGLTVACFDLLVPDIGELIGGSLREHDFDRLNIEIKRRSMDIKPLEWYLGLRRNGTVPHGGFGMGFERLLQYLSCTENIRDVIPFPRSANNCLC